MKRRDFLTSVSSAGFALALSGRAGFASLLKTEASAVKTYHSRVKGQLKMLVVSDLHTVQGCANDIHTFSDIRTIISKYSPELIIVTGDLIPDNSLASHQWVVTELGKLGLPWAYVPGNHDVPTNIAQVHSISTAAANSLHAATVSDPNFRIEVCNPGETTPVWNFFMMDDSWPIKGMQQYTVDWFASEATRIGSNPPPAFFFFHIPLIQYQQLWNTGTCIGVRGETECYEQGISTAFADFKTAGNGMIRAMFCGHDHANNYYGVMDGIRLQYVQNTGYNGYGSALKRGGTLITMDTVAGSFVTKSVYADDPVNVANESALAEKSIRQRVRLEEHRLVFNTKDKIQDFKMFDSRGRLLFMAPGEISNGSVQLNVPASQGIAHYRIGGFSFCEKLAL
jgi:3',5'-cyclic AMP phosphodiesterase CpdA